VGFCRRFFTVVGSRSWRGYPVFVEAGLFHPASRVAIADFGRNVACLQLGKVEVDAAIRIDPTEHVSVNVGLRLCRIGQRRQRIALGAGSPNDPRMGPSTVEFCGEGSGRCDGDRSTRPGGAGECCRFSGWDSTEKRPQQADSDGRGSTPNAGSLSLSRLPPFAPALDDQVQHRNEK
jgi:hypothetical protein